MNIAHDEGREVGEVIHLERTAQHLWAVAHVDDRIDPAKDRRVYWSASTTSTEDGSDVEITELALTEFPRQIGLSPLVFLRGALDHRAAPARWSLDRFPRHLLERAATTSLDRRAQGSAAPIIVHDDDTLARGYSERAAASLDAPPTGQLRFRSAEQLGVSYPARTIELIVMPYETETLAEYEGRMIKEIVSRGAFAGVEKRAGRVRVNRDHDRARTVGRAVSFNPHHAEGLIAELRIARTPLGDETLALAEEDCLDASAGYLPLPGGEQWRDRNYLRVRRAWLGHIAMTPDPAYESARVLTVRHS